MTISLFQNVTLAPSDPILGLTEKYLTDTNPKKVNLGVGVYNDDSGKLPLLECVKQAQQQILTTAQPFNYLPITGLADYNRAVQHLVFGAESAAVAEKRITTVQTLGGSGALKIGADFLHLLNPNAKVLTSNPSWANHKAIFSAAGFTVDSYAYYDAANKKIDFAAMLNDLKQAAAGSIIILHVCCHNPTGYDLTAEQWQQVIQVCQEQQLVPFLDMAYQGFAYGLEEDGQVIAKFTAAGLNVFVSTSFSKSLGLYGQRVGALSVVCASAEEATRVQSQLKVVIRTNYSSPPIFGATVAAKVLTSPALNQLWREELGQMRERIKLMRQKLVTGLQAAGVKRDMSFITQQHGMFSFSGLGKDEMVRLREEFAVYGTDNGRICIAALNSSNIDYVCRSIAEVLG